MINNILVITFLFCIQLFSFSLSLSPSSHFPTSLSLSRSRSRSLLSYQSLLSLSSSSNNNNNANDFFEESRIKQTVTDTSDVDSILRDIMAMVSRTALVQTDNSNKNKLEEEASQDSMKIATTFNNILRDLKESKTIGVDKKKTLEVEIGFMIDDIKKSESNVVDFLDSRKNILNDGLVKTSSFSPIVSPYCVVYGPGVVGQEILKSFKALGKAIDVRYIEADQLAVMQDAEINYAVKGAKTIIIAADEKRKSGENSDNDNNNNKKGGGGGWFGLPIPSLTDSSEVSASIINEKALKRLLNASMNERNKAPTPYAIKVVALARACKPSKSLASFMGGGDASDWDSEVILQSVQRGLGYAIVKSGNIINDNAALPQNAKVRSLKQSLLPQQQQQQQFAAATTSTSKSEDGKADIFLSQIPDSSVIFTRSRVENAEATRLSVAVEALLRSAVYPSSNSSISVLSTESLNKPTDKEWDDEFLKINGPELHRIPLRYASTTQLAIKLGRIALDLQEPGSGLITPIEVERYSNGVKILFRPKDNSVYLSSKEERLKAQTENDESNNSKTSSSSTITSASNSNSNPKRKSGYLSPEEESAINNPISSVPANTITAAASKKKKPEKPEGGLEIIIDNSPYRRVRIRRCNMNKETIVKEESEAILLKALLRGIEVLENDYRVLLNAKK